MVGGGTSTSSVRAAIERTPLKVSFSHHVVYRDATSTARVRQPALPRPLTAASAAPPAPRDLPSRPAAGLAPPTRTDLRLLPFD